MQKDAITTEEAARILGVTPTRVRAMIAAGQIPAEKFGPLHVIRMKDLALVAGRKPGRPRSPRHGEETAADRRNKR